MLSLHSKQGGQEKALQEYFIVLIITILISPRYQDPCQSMLLKAGYSLVYEAVDFHHLLPCSPHVSTMMMFYNTQNLEF